MKTLKHFIFIVLAVITITSCHKEKVIKADYRDQWMGEYAYISDRDGGMEGKIYADKSEDNYVNIYINGIGELLKMKVEEDGSLTLIKPGSDWGNYRNFEGAFTDGLLEYSFEILTPGTVINRHFIFEKAI